MRKKESKIGKREKGIKEVDDLFLFLFVWSRLPAELDLHSSVGQKPPFKNPTSTTALVLFNVTHQIIITAARSTSSSMLSIGSTTLYTGFSSTSGQVFQGLKFLICFEYPQESNSDKQHLKTSIYDTFLY